jgi:hypothetical protein
MGGGSSVSLYRGDRKRGSQMSAPLALSKIALMIRLYRLKLQLKLHTASSKPSKTTNNEKLLVSFQRSFEASKSVTDIFHRYQPPLILLTPIETEYASHNSSMHNLPIEAGDSTIAYCISPQNYHEFGEKKTKKKRRHSIDQLIHDKFELRDRIAVDIEKMEVIQEAREKFQRVINQLQSSLTDDMIAYQNCRRLQQ